MRCSSSSVCVTIAALLVLASCSPLEDSDGSARISLSKRGSFIKDDGSFDMDSAIEHTVFIRNKYRQNLINAKRNIGEEEFNDGADITPLATLPDRLRKGQVENLTDSDERDWVGEISIGIPPQLFVVKLDIATSDLWVPSDSCESDDVCPYKRRYSADASATCQEEDGNYKNKYLDDSEVQGPIFSDRVKVGGIIARSQYFSPVTSLSSKFRYEHSDGHSQKPFFYAALAQGAVTRGEFAFYLASNDSELYLGGTNPARYNGDIEYHDVTSKPDNKGFWQIGGASLRVNDKVVYKGLETVFDTGTSFIYGHLPSVNALFAAVSGSSELNSTNGITFYSYPCENPPDFQINWGGTWWPVKGSNFNQGETSPGSGACVSSVMGIDPGLGIHEDHWLLGDSFLKNVYTAFNIETNSVGFASPAA